jgi:hypothetical protein
MNELLSLLGILLAVAVYCIVLALVNRLIKKPSNKKNLFDEFEEKEKDHIKMQEYLTKVKKAQDFLKQKGFIISFEGAPHYNFIIKHHNFPHAIKMIRTDEEFLAEAIKLGFEYGN